MRLTVLLLAALFSQDQVVRADSNEPALTDTPPAAATPPTPIDPEHDPCHFFETETDFVAFNLDLDIEGIIVPLGVPKIYMEDRWKRKDGVTSTAFLFRVGIADFEPVTRAETSRRRKAGRPRDWMSFVLGDLVPMEKILLYRVENNYYVRDLTREQIASEPFAHGLHRILPPDPSKEISHEILVDRMAGVPQTIMECNLPVPRYLGFSCQTEFEYEGINASLSFDRSELAHWRENRARIVRFVQCLIEHGEN